MSNLPNIFSFRYKYFLVFWYLMTVILVSGIVYQFGWKFSGFMGLLGLVFPAYLAMGGFYLRNELHLRGYDWVTFGMAFKLTARLYSKAWRLPPRDQAASIPGYEDTIEGLQKVISQAHDQTYYDFKNMKLKVIPKVQEYLETHGPFSETPNVSFLVRVHLGYMGVVVFFFVLLIILSIVVVVSILTFDSDYFWVYSFLGAGIGFYYLLASIFIRKRFRQLGYKEITLTDATYIYHALKSSVLILPYSKDLKNALETNEELSIEQICDAVYSIQEYNKPKYNVY